MQTLKLNFGTGSKFPEFLEWYLHRAGSSWNDDQVVNTGNGNYEITATAQELYTLGYDWALYQFPPNN